MNDECVFINNNSEKCTQKISQDQLILCEQHKIQVHTSQMALNHCAYICMENLLAMTKRANTCSTIEQSRLIFKDILEYCIRNMQFINNHDKIKQSLLNKLSELKNSDSLNIYKYSNILMNMKINESRMCGLIDNDGTKCARHLSYSHDQTMLCDHHRFQLYESHAMLNHDKQIFVKNINVIFNTINELGIKKQKCLMARNLFEYCAKNMQFVNDRPIFRKALLDKLNEFKNDEIVIENSNLFDVNKYLIIFAQT